MDKDKISKDKDQKQKEELYKKILKDNKDYNFVGNNFIIRGK